MSNPSERLFDCVDKWANARPGITALIEAETGEAVNWKGFQRGTRAFAAKLRSLGLKKGDVIATSLPMIKEHLYLIYGCYRLGIRIAPLDLRLKLDEVDQAFTKMKPAAYFFLGKTEAVDFRPMVSELRKRHSDCKHWVQFQKETDLLLLGVTGILDFARDIKWQYVKSSFTGSVRRAERRVSPGEPCLIIFTTGSTGDPKPCLLTHENIFLQMKGLATVFGMKDDDRMLVNLPPSHVGCMTEQLSIFVEGGSAVLLPIFKAKASLVAIEKYKVTALGQIPAMFNMEWACPGYEKYDRRSLRLVIYAGQSVSDRFLAQVAKMSPSYGTGFGLTEVAGFCTHLTGDARAGSVGQATPYCQVTIREPLESTGKAGARKKDGETGEVCVEGPQVFAGYLNDPENTKRTRSIEGVCYTGDLGFVDGEGLHLVGRSKFIIKPKGHQVFPTEVENYFETQFSDRINAVACVGAEHEMFVEAILLFVEPKPAATISEAEINDAAKALASYKRPAGVVLLQPGKMPLNRVAKTDYVLLKHQASELIHQWRTEGKWDRQIVQA